MICLHCKRLGHLCPDCDAKRNAAFAPVTEPLAETLRRLHREATPIRPPQRTDEIEHVCFRIDHDDEWIETVQRLLPALADIVAVIEHEYGHTTHAGRSGVCEIHPLCRALAALREQLGAKP